MSYPGFSRGCVFALGLLLAVWSRVVAASVTRQIEEIFEPDHVVAAALAPDGRHVAFAVRDGRGIEMTIHDVSQKERPGDVRLDSRIGTQVSFFGWSAADRLIVVPNGPLVLEIELGARTARVVTDEKALAGLTKKRRSGRPVIRVLALQRQPEVATLEVRWSTGGGEMLLDVVRVDLRTGELQLMHTTTVISPVGELRADLQGRPRLAYDRDGRGRHYLYLPPDGGPRDWKPLDRILGRARDPLFEVTPQNFLGERAVPLGFGADANRLYYATNEGRDTFGVSRLDLATGKHEVLAVDERGMDFVNAGAPFPDDVLILDRARGDVVGLHATGPEEATLWWDEELTGVQAIVEKKFPDRRVRLLEWDDARSAFLVNITADHDPGRYFVFRRDDGRCIEYLRQSSLNAADANRVETFAIDRPADAGGPVRARITWPHAPATPKPPLLVWLHDAPWLRTHESSQRVSQAWAAMGYVVLEVDYRGTPGFGRAPIEAVRTGYDRVPLDDVLVAIAALRKRDAFDPAHVAVAGEGFGGYLALRGLQLHPEVFRTAAAINAPIDLVDTFRSERDVEAYRRSVEQAFSASSAANSSFTNTEASSGSGSSVIPGGPDAGGGAPPVVPGRGASSLGGGFGGGGSAPSFERDRARAFFGEAGRQRIAVDDDLDALTQPVLLAHDPRLSSPESGPVERLRDALLRRKQVVEWVELAEGYARDNLEVRGELAWRIGEFFRNQLGAVPAEGGTP